MQQSWLFHASGSSATLIKQVSSEATRVSDGIIQPLLQLNAKLVLAFFISTSLLIYNPLIAIGGLLIFFFAYLALYKMVQNRLKVNGQNISRLLTDRFRLMNEGFGGIKDVLLLNRHFNFVNRFTVNGKSIACAIGINNAISQVPRYFMELIAFGSMIMLVLFLMKTYQGNLGSVLPVLSVYALAAFKLLPAFQQIYSNIVLIKGNIAAFDAIKDDLAQSINTQEYLTKSTVEKIESSGENVTFVPCSLTSAFPTTLTSPFGFPAP